MYKNRILVLSDLREFTETVAQKAIYLANKYEKEIIEKALEASGIDPKRRGETLTILEFASLSNQIYCLRRETPNK